MMNLGHDHLWSHDRNPLINRKLSEVNDVQEFTTEK